MIKLNFVLKGISQCNKQCFVGGEAAKRSKSCITSGMKFIFPSPLLKYCIASKLIIANFKLPVFLLRQGCEITMKYNVNEGSHPIARQDMFI